MLRVDVLVEHLRDRLERLAPEATSLVVAVSGGLDSTVLLHALAACGLDLQVAHLDHALRPDSAEDAAFVAAQAERLGLPCHHDRIDVGTIAATNGWNLEDAARRLRYAFLHRVARRVGAEAIATGHTRDDQVETVLMQLLRGAAYLRGMPARRGRVIRPLLGLPRRQLRAAANRLGLDYRHDPSNDDPRLTRAWLRREILPRLRARFPAADDRIAVLAEQQSELAAFVHAEAGRRLGNGPVALGALARAQPALQREAIATMLRGAGVAVEAERVAAALRLAAAEAPGRMTLAPGKTLRSAYGRLELVAAAAGPTLGPVQEAGDLPPGVPAAVLAHFPTLERRSRRPGDRIVLPGGSRKVADVLIDAKIPRERRDALTLLATGDQVHWIEGVARSQPFAELGVAHPDPDLPFMLRALELAEAAAAAGELPVGALLVRDGAVLGQGRNRSEGDHDPSAHAEVVALRAAAVAAGDWRLSGTTLYVTLEPCAMCFGAALQAHVGRIVYGADNRREGALGSVADLSAAPWKRRIEIRSGLLAAASSELLGRFFAVRRSQPSASDT